MESVLAAGEAAIGRLEPPSAAVEVGEHVERRLENSLVFLCAFCRRPLGDSLTWVTGLEDANCILLRSQFGAVLPRGGFLGAGWGRGREGAGCPSKP